MDEQAWLSSNNVRPMILRLREEFGAARTKAGRRKLRLFQAACFRQIWGALDDPIRHLVESLEQIADGRMSEGTLPGLRKQAVEYLQQSGYAGFPYFLA